MTAPESNSRDWVSNFPARLAAWDLPTLAIIVSLLADTGTRTAVWSISLAWMGIACLANAKRCGRRHCHYTGPFFLLMAVATLLHGGGIVSLGPHGWWWLGSILIIIGYGVLWYLPERLWGKFRRSGASGVPQGESDPEA